MGQEQSTEKSSPPSVAGDDGVRFVEGSGSNLRPQATESEADNLLKKSESLVLPQPLLPPPPVEDNISSALQGAQMIHELRILLDSLLQPATGASDSNKGGKTEKVNTDGTTNMTSKTPATLDRHEAESSTKVEVDLSTQDAWSRFGIDANTLDKVIADCTGGDRMAQFVDKQSNLLEKMKHIAELATRLKLAVDLQTEQARKTSKTIEKLDRLSLSITDVQDTLEQVVATANILGAANFADDPEMHSFKAFLKHHPLEY